MGEGMAVIVGVGEITDRPEDPAQGKEPAALMTEALHLADADAGGGLLSALDSLDIVNEISWPYRDPVGQVGARLGRRPARAEYGVVGGQTPIQFLHDAALRIARGESAIAAVCGGEAAATVQQAARSGVALPWSDHDPDHVPIRGSHYQRPVAKRLNVATPTNVYPFYENATLAAWGQSPQEAQAESAALWSRMSEVAADQPNAWLRRRFSPSEIATPSAENRPIAWPYLKLMVANPTVNQGAAILLTSLARAQAAGIAEHKLIHIWGGAAAREPRDYLARDDYRHSSAMECVLKTVMRDTPAFDFVEVYSCFPCVPKMARRVLGLREDAIPTVTGGLTFFGAPLNNYMGHAAVAMVRRLREKPGGVGLLYGQGGYVTNHHALVVASCPSGRALHAEYSVQHLAEARRGLVPELLDSYHGAAVVETFTVLFDRQPAPTHGVVIAHTGRGQRLMACVPAEDRNSLAFLMNLERSAIGANGQVRPGPDGILQWSCT
jgi:acetyl-CoA C-acetyltransferase